MSSERRRPRRESSDEECSYEDERTLYFIPATGINIEVLIFYLKKFLGHDSDALPGQHPKNRDIDGYYIKSRLGLSAPMVEDIKRDSLSWRTEPRTKRKRHSYSESDTAHERVRRGASGPPTIPAKTETSASEEAYLWRWIVEHTNTSWRPSNGISQTPKYTQTDSGYGGSDPSVYEPAVVSSLGDGQPTPRSTEDRCRHEGIAPTSINSDGPSVGPTANTGPPWPYRPNAVTSHAEDPLAFSRNSDSLSIPPSCDNISRDFEIMKHQLTDPAPLVSRYSDDDITSWMLLDHLEQAPTRPAYGNGVIMKHSKVSTSSPDSAMQEVCVKAEIKPHRSSIATYESEIQELDECLRINHAYESDYFVEVPRKEKAAEVPKLPSPELNSPTSTSSSEGENSFMESIDSDEAAHIWETELDPRLHSLRSKLIQVLVASYIDTASLAVNSQTTQYLAAANSPSGHAKSSSTSSSFSLSDTKPSSASTGKRRRDHNSNDNDNDEDHEDQQRQPSRKKLRHTNTSISIDGRLLACPYCKYDPTRYSERNIDEKNYRGCSSIYLTSISRVKQHLYRVHKRPDYYCACCFSVYQDEAALSAHSRMRPACEVKEACFTEKMATEQVNFIKRRTIGKTPSDTWFEIYKILFPHAPLPETPYVETVSPGAIQRFTDHFYRQAGSRLAALVQTELQGRMLLERDQQRILDSALESAIGQLVWQTGPHTSFEDAEPEVNVSHPEADFAASPNVQASRENIPVDEQLEISLGDQLFPTQPNFAFGFHTGDPYSFNNNARPTTTGHVPVDGHEDENSCPLLSDPIEDGGLNDWFEREFSN